MDRFWKLGWNRQATHDPEQETSPDPAQRKIQEPSTGSSSGGNQSPPSFSDGVKILHDDLNASVDICFIHGLTGDRDSTWTADGHSTPWPGILLPPHLNKTRIITYGYDAYVVRRSAVSANRLLDHATNLLNDLTNDRASCNASSRPLIFVAHSMGGLVCKEAILLSRNNPERHLRPIFESTIGIAFMGTPHKGSWMSNWAIIPAAAVSLVRSVKTSLLDVLRTDNQFLESIQVRFLAMMREQRENGRPLQVTCFYEELPLPPIGRVVVSKDSATLDGYNLTSIHADHRNMVRFSHAEETGFKRLLGELVRWTIIQYSPAAMSTRSDACLRSLAFGEMDTHFHDIDHAVAGKKWESSDRSLLWIKGKAGCGKSTLLKYALDNFQATGDLVLSSFFHGGGVDLQRTPLGLVQCLLHQILRQTPESAPVLLDTFEKKCKEIGDPGVKWKWHEAELWSFFELSLKSILRTRSVWLFLDALDECGEDNAVRLIRRLEILLKSLPRDLGRLHVCFSCRPYPVLAPDGTHEIHPQHENKADISTLVDDRLSEFPTLALTAVPALIIDGASGIFMWADLVTERILRLMRQGISTQEIESEIHLVPPKLDNWYQGLLETMGPASLKLIQWTCFSIRPLSVDELRWAMIIPAEPGGPTQSLQAYMTAVSDNDRMKRQVRTLSCGLIEVTPSEPQVVQFIHQSVRDFFTSKGLLNLDRASTSPDNAKERAHFQLSRICIRYLTMEGIHQLPDEPTSYEHREKSEYERSKFRKKQVKEFSAAHPFLAYAANYWTGHVRRCSNQAELLDSSTQLCDMRMKSSHTWFEVYWMEKLEDRPSWPPLMVASAFGLDLVATRLVQSGDKSLIKAEDRYGRTALLKAAENGHEFVVGLLLRRGADLEDQDHYQGGNPLYLAAKEGHKAVVQRLAKAGADIYDYDDSNNQSAIHIAAVKGHLDVVRYLLNFYKNVEIEADSQRPLHSAVEGRTGDAVIKMLVEEYHADINAFNECGRTPLHLAIEDGNEDLIRYFLEIGADTTCQAPFELLGYDDDEEDFGGTALHCAASSSGLKPTVLQDILRRSPDLDARDIYGRTALHRAAWRGQDTAVKLLLEAGADAHPEDDELWTPLFYATLHGCKAVVQLLLPTRPMDTHSEAMHDGVLLLSAAETGDANVVKQLLDHNTNTEVAVPGGNEDGATPLILAAREGHVAIVQLLLLKGAVVEARGDGWTPLLSAAKRGHEAIVQDLLNADADVEARIVGGSSFHSGKTSLIVAACEGHATVLQQLLRKRADIDATCTSNDYEAGRTALCFAAAQGCERVVQCLLDNGANINSKDRKGRTPLSLAAENGRKVVVQQLLDRDADITIGDADRWTPLNWAAERKKWSVVELLLDKYARATIESPKIWTPLYSSASIGQADLVRSVLEKGAVGESDSDGCYAVIAAASQGHVEVVKHLLSSGADANAPSQDGWTPLNAAASNGHVEVAKLLLSEGADAAVPSRNGWTPLNTAANNGCYEVVRLFLKSGVNAGQRHGKYTWTPLFGAALGGFGGIVELLLNTVWTRTQLTRLVGCHCHMRPKTDITQSS